MPKGAGVSGLRLYRENDSVQGCTSKEAIPQWQMR